MSARRSIYVSQKVPFEGPDSPNSTVNQVTLETRLFFPPNVTGEQLRTMWDNLVYRVDEEIAKWGIEQAEEASTKASQKAAEDSFGEFLNEVFDQIFSPSQGVADSIMRNLGRFDPRACDECGSTHSVSMLGLCAECNQWV